MLDRRRALVVLIDLQDSLLPGTAEVSERLVGKVHLFLQAAQSLDLPSIVTEQNPAKLGSTTGRLAGALGDTPRIGKVEFSCFANGDVRQAIHQTGRNQVLLCGVETHVCVLQTALEAQAAGFQPFVLADAVAAKQKREHKAGLERLRQHGVDLVTVQMAVFELLRAAGTPEFKALLPVLKQL